MLKNYIILTIRRLIRERAYAVLNIVGLSVGIAFFLLATLFVRDELTYDQFHTNASQIYRITANVRDAFKVIVPNEIGPLLKDRYAGIEEVSYIGGAKEITIRHNDELFVEKGFIKANPSVFHLFDFPLQSGTDSLALLRPNTAVVSSYIAQKYFPDTTAVGSILKLVDGTTYEITGILAEIPRNSSFRFNILATTVTREYNVNSGLGDLFVLTKQGYTKEKLETNLQEVLQANKSEEEINYQYHVDPVADIHLYATDKIAYSDGISGDIRYVYIVGTVGVLILLIACINFVNLSTARSSERAKEVGVRKVIGANRTQLLSQFMGETFCLVGLAILLGGVITELLLPLLNEIASKSLSMQYFSDPFVISFIAFLVPTLTLFTGFYPAFVLSSYRPARTLKGRLLPSTRGLGFSFRKGLTVFQFGISSVLIVSTLIIWQQLNLLRDTNLGFQRDNILVIQNPIGKFKSHRQLKSQLLQLPTVLGVTSAPMPGINDIWFTKVDTTESDSEGITIYGFNVDEDFFDLLEVEVTEGRIFRKSSADDFNRAVIVNQAAVEAFGIENPVGTSVKSFNDDLDMEDKTIIGVIDNFQYRSLKREEVPTIIRLSNDRLSNVLVKISPSDITGTIQRIRNEWKAINPDLVFDYRFLDDTYDNLYRQDIRLGRIFTVFATVAILIASLGLFGLVTYTTKTRTKEIGIRKTLGASVTQIVLLLSKSFTQVILLSIAIATPVAWYLMQLWLQSFQQKMKFGASIFLLTGTLILIAVLLTTGFQTVRAALANPVNSLRNE
ncbi:MAG: ABC transporter permease [Cyclobacteriaceae bacterium]